MSEGDTAFNPQPLTNSLNVIRLQILSLGPSSGVSYLAKLHSIMNRITPQPIPEIRISTPTDQILVLSHHGGHQFLLAYRITQGHNLTHCYYLP